MGHVVHYRDATGELRLDEAGSLDAALERAEQLRNDGDVEEVRIFKEIRTQVRTYYKVVAVDDDDASSGVPDAAAASADPSGGPLGDAANDAPTDEAADASTPPPESVGAPDAPQPPPGAMPLSGPPHARVHTDAIEGESHDEPPGESRRPSFLSRGGS